MTIAQTITFTDDFNGEEITNPSALVEIVITNKLTGDVVTSHISQTTYEGIINEEDEFSNLFLHDE